MSFLPSKESFSDDSLEPFLSDHGQDRIERQFDDWKQRFGVHRLLPIAIHLLLVAVYTFITVIVVKQATSRSIPEPRQTITYSPASHAVSYQPHIYDSTAVNNKTLYGPPSEEKHQAWEDLLSPANIKFSQDEVNKIGFSQNIQLPDGSYFGSLWVYHQLHCLRRISHLMYPEYYYPNLTGEEEYGLRAHMIHCFQTLQEDIMCHGDTTPMTFKWGSLQSMPISNFNNQHECVNWDAIDQWSRERMFDPFAPGVMVHPKYGPAYASNLENDRAHKVGAVDDHA